MNAQRISWRRWLGGLLALGLLAAMWARAVPARAQTPSPLATPTFGGPYIVVIGNGEYQINVRAGPGIDYPAVGILVLGQKAPALARTRNWVQIVYPGAHIDLVFAVADDHDVRPAESGRG